MAVLYFPLSPQIPLLPSAEVLGAHFLEKLEAIRPNLPALLPMPLLPASPPAASPRHHCCLDSGAIPSSRPGASTPGSILPLSASAPSPFLPYRSLLHTHKCSNNFLQERERGRKEGGKEDREGRRKKRGKKEGKYTTTSVKVLAGKQNSCRGFN